jgi:hypothetical protein
MRFVTSICYGSVIPRLSTNPQKKGKKKRNREVICLLEWRKKKKSLYIGSLRIIPLRQISIDNNSKCIRSIKYPICKFRLKLEIVKINFQKKTHF